MAHRVILSTVDVRNFDDTLNVPSNITYPFCNLGFAEDGGDYLFRGIAISDVKDDADFGSTQTIKVKLIINGKNAKELTKNIAKIWSIILPTRRYYESILKRTSTRSDNSGHGADLATFLVNSGVDTTLYSKSGATGILSVKPDGLDETCCYDIIDGDLHLPANFMNLQWGSNKIVDAELELTVYAGARGERSNIRQIIRNGNIENLDCIQPFNFSWFYDKNKFKVLTRSSALETAYGSSASDKLKGKFGPSFLEFTNDSAFSGVTYSLVPEVISKSDYNLFDKNDGTGFQSEDLSYTPSIWLYFYDSQFNSGYITAYVEYGVVNGSSIDWTVDQQFVFLPNGTPLPSQEWVQYIGTKKPYVSTSPSVTGGNGSITQWRMRLELSASSNNVVNGFNGVAIDGIGMFIEPTGIPGESANVGAGEYACMDVYTSTYNLYGIRGDMETEARIRTNFSRFERGVAVTSVSHNRGKYEEAPIPYTVEVTGNGYGLPGSTDVGVINAQNDWIFTSTRQTVKLQDSNVLRRTFYYNVAADRVPRNYYCFLVYGADSVVGNIATVTLVIGGEKTIFNVNLPYTHAGGASVVEALAYLGEVQFPQPNGSSEDYAQTDTQINSTRDSIQFDLATVPAWSNIALTFGGLLFIPTECVGTLDITGIASASVNPYNYLIQSSETKSPSAALQIIPTKNTGNLSSSNVAPLSNTKTPPVPLTSVVDTGTYMGGDFRLIPVINPDNIREYEQFTFFDIYMNGTSFWYLGTGADNKYTIGVGYTPRYKYGTGQFLKGAVKDSSSKSYANALALANYNKSGFTPSGVTSLAVSNSGGVNTVSFNFAVGGNPAPTHVIVERRLTQTNNPLTFQPYYFTPIAIYSGYTASYSIPDSVDANGTWEYRVKTANTNGVTTSNIVSAVVAGLPNAPTRMKVTNIGATGIVPVLAWTDNSSGTASFKVERKTGVNGSWSQIGTTVAGVTTYTDNTASDGTLYYYRVRASNATGNSRYDSEMSSGVRDTSITTVQTTLQKDSLTKKILSAYNTLFSWRSTKAVPNLTLEVAIRSNDNLAAGDATKWAKLLEQVIDYAATNTALNTDISGYLASNLKTIDTMPYTAPLTGDRWNSVTPYGVALERYNQFSNLRVYPAVDGGQVGYFAGNNYIFGNQAPAYNSGLGFWYRQYRYVKLYLSWELLQPTLGAALNATELTKVTNAITDIVASGAAKAILCLNSNGKYNGTQLTVSGAAPNSASLQDFWGRISDAYKTNVGVDAYEIMNEPNSYASDATPRTPTQVHEKLMQDVVTYLRTTKTDTKRLIIPSYYLNTNGSNYRDISTIHTANFITDTANNWTLSVHANFDDTQTGTYSKTYDAENVIAISQGY